MRILVCDDDAGTRLVVKHLLMRKLGCDDIVECGNGVDGLAALASSPFDLAIVDVNMPQLDGINMVAAVRDSPRLTDIRVVMLTADRREDVVRQLLELGVSDYIAKPLVPDVVVAKLDRILKSIVLAGGCATEPVRATA